MSFHGRVETVIRASSSEIHQALHDVNDRRLRDIERALQKIEEGSYGLSDQSGEPIPKARLETMPEVIPPLDEEQREETGR